MPNAATHREPEAKLLASGNHGFETPGSCYKSPYRHTCFMAAFYLLRRRAPHQAVLGAIA